MFTSENIQKSARVVLYWAAGALVSKGIIQPDPALLELTIGVVVTLVNMAWTVYGSRLNGLLAQVQAKDGVLLTSIVVDSRKIDASAVNAATPAGVSAK